jgi:DNA invertase Pin-like site-specific DNA recombinase
MSLKIADQHLARQACIYIRQSTMGQVRFNQESTERQYNLTTKAESLGWKPEQIRILDRDLGQSGSATTNREDFKALVGEVAMGRVGAIFSLEASRLARSNQDWHRLLELCAITSTLVIDEDGCYNPAEFNDGLVLGMKGTFAQAELHIIRARLHGGKLNKASKGELRFPLPVGFVFEGDKIALDPDQEVQGAVRTVFDLFARENTAFGVVRRYNELDLRFPRRAYGGAWDGKLFWGRLTHSRVLGILANPSYAGAYVFGRHQSSKEVGLSGEIRTRSRLMPQEAWRVVIPDHHEGYISADQFIANRQRLSTNRTNAEGLAGPAREGLCLLQGLLSSSMPSIDPRTRARTLSSIASSQASKSKTSAATAASFVVIPCKPRCTTPFGHTEPTATSRPLQRPSCPPSLRGRRRNPDRRRRPR